MLLPVLLHGDKNEMYCCPGEMQQIIFPNNYIVPFALQNKVNWPKGNTMYNTIKNKDVLRKILTKCNQENTFLEMSALN